MKLVDYEILELRKAKIKLKSKTNNYEKNYFNTCHSHGLYRLQFYVNE